MPRLTVMSPGLASTTPFALVAMIAGERAGNKRKSTATDAKTNTFSCVTRSEGIVVMGPSEYIVTAAGTQADGHAAS